MGYGIETREGKSKKKNEMIDLDGILFTKNVMIPVVKVTTSKREPFPCSVAKERPRIVDMQKQASRNTSSFLRVPEESLEVLKAIPQRSEDNKTCVVCERTTPSKRSEKRSQRKKKEIQLSFPDSFPCSRQEKRLREKKKRSDKSDSNKTDRSVPGDANKLQPEVSVSKSKESEKTLERENSDVPFTQNDLHESFLTMTTTTTIGKETFSSYESKSFPANDLTSEREITVLSYENPLSHANPVAIATPSFSQEKEIKSEETKYSWSNIWDWIPPSNKNESIKLTAEEGNPLKRVENFYDRKIKYSWQAIGRSSQTSRVLLETVNKSRADEFSDEEKEYQCKVRYSWQIIGTGTQACLESVEDSDYWDGVLCTPRRFTEKRMNNLKSDMKRFGRAILRDQSIQTVAEKENQADLLDCRVKYSWETLLARYLKSIFKIDLQDHPREMDEKEKPSRTIVTDDWDGDQEESSKKRDLLTRLAYATKKLNLYEEDPKRTDDQWSLDTGDLCVSENLIENGRLPSHVEENMKGIAQSAQEYIAKLEEQLMDLESADQQLEKSTAKTLDEIDETYQTLAKEICREIERRRELLRLETEVHRKEGLITIKSFKREVESQVDAAKRLIGSIDGTLKRPWTFDREKFGKIVEMASGTIGRIPAVPYSDELPCVCFNRPSNSSTEEILERISELGRVSRTGPVRIVEIEEKPASLYVRWRVTDPEYAGEEQTFRLEMANGEVLDPAANTFETVYEGPDTSCFVRDLPVNQPITLRVRTGNSDLAWSPLRVSKTSIPGYSWELGNKNYVITNDGRIAAKIGDGLSTLFSEGPQYDVNQIIEFKFLEASADGTDEEGIALADHPKGDQDTLRRPGSLMIASSGRIFMDGEEKSMRLPKMRLGTKVTIVSDRRDADTLRVNIECTDKCVTYYWRVRGPLHFAARFKEYNKWNLMVK